MTDMTQTRITAEEYFQLPEYKEHEFIQLIDGKVVIQGAEPVIEHQFVVGEVFVSLHTIAKKKGGRAIMAPADVYLNDDTIYQPDVFYLSPDTNCKISDKRVMGAPELVIEILSLKTAKYDRTTKYSAYEQHGVQEYWIVDPAHGLVEVWTQGDSGFERVGAFAPDDEFESLVLAESIDVNAIFDVS